MIKNNLEGKKSILGSVMEIFLLGSVLAEM